MKRLLLPCIIFLLSGVAWGAAPFVTLPGTDETVYCTIYPPRITPGNKAGLVIHLYGHGGSNVTFNIGRTPFDTLRQRITERGYWLVIPDLGPRHWMNNAAVARLDAVIAEWIEHEHVDPARVHLIGSSMGAYSSLLYVMRRPGKVRSLAAIFPVTDQVRFWDEKTSYRQSVGDAHGLPAANREEALRALSPVYHPDAFRQTPLFLLHGAKDNTVVVEHSRRLASELQQRGYLLVYRESPDAAHKDEIVVPYQEELADFLTKPDSAIR